MNTLILRTLLDAYDNLPDCAIRKTIGAAIYEEASKLAVGLTDAERELAKFNRVLAIRAIRARLGVGLRDALELVNKG